MLCSVHMSTQHRFGGPWTDQKLYALKGYLEAYRHIFTSNLRARHFRTIYVDAFAGTGSRTPGSADETITVPNDRDAATYREGSATIALELDSPFDEYVFIEKDRERADELERLVWNYPSLVERADVLVGDANSVLRQWCGRLDTKRYRSVVFLDPYGMQVEWSTIEAIAQTQAIDMWLLFPLGQAINRLLTRNQLPTGAIAERLTRTFGTDAWQEAFYKVNPQQSLFGNQQEMIKQTDLDGIAEFFVERLNSVFHAVAPGYKSLRNSRNVPIYILCFAAANPRGAPPAIRIASHLLRNDR